MCHTCLKQQQKKQKESDFAHQGRLIDEMLNAGLRKYYNQNELFLPPVRSIASQTTPETVCPTDLLSNSTHQSAWSPSSDEAEC